MSTSEIENIRAAVDYEIQRTKYPEHMPVLPKVPAARYAEPEFYELELKHMWHKAWLHAGHTSELQQAGDYKIFNQVGLSVIISRGKDNVIRAFHNICRHRGAPLLVQSKGNANRLTCPYHAWTYSSEGDLVAVPDSQDFAPLDHASLGLMPVKCEILRGLIFINADSNAEPVANSCAAIPKALGNIPLENATVKEVYSVEMDCNWKVAYDNFLEIYHVRTVHAKSVARFLNSKSFSVDLFKNGHARFITRKQSSPSFFGKQSAEQDSPAALLDEYTLAIPIFPNSFMPVDPTNFTCQGFWPVSPNKTVMVMYMMSWDEENEDETLWSEVREQIKGIIDEDNILVAGIQRSMESGFLPGVMFNYQERAVYWYHEEIDRRIGIDNIPEEWRVQQVLAPHINKDVSN